MPKKPWKKMTRAERRVAIAKDVIRWIDDGLFSFKSGHSYVRTKNEDVELDLPTNTEQLDFGEKDARHVANQCHVCARGGLLLTRMAFGGVSTSIQDSISRLDEKYICTNGLKDAFTRKQLDKIEAVFELSEGNVFYDDSHMPKWKKFSDKDRMRAICQNIIDHKGKFRPEVEYEVVAA